MRYFIIFFDWTHEGKHAVGNISWSHNVFPSHKKVAELIADKHKIPASAVVITNLLEVNKEDHESWIK